MRLSIANEVGPCTASAATSAVSSTMLTSSPIAESISHAQ
jgi:hypothetical protein